MNNGATYNYARNKRFEIDLASSTRVLLSIKNAKLANKILKVLGREYRLKQGEEMAVRLSPTELKGLAPILNIRNLAAKIEADFNSGRMAKHWQAGMQN